VRSLAEGKTLSVPDRAYDKDQNELSFDVSLTDEEQLQRQRELMLKEHRCVSGRHGLRDAPVVRPGGLTLSDPEYNVFVHGSVSAQRCAVIFLLGIALAVAYAILEPFFI